MDQFRMQTGWDTTPVPLNQLSPPLLSEYAQAGVELTEWHDYVSRELDGNRNYVEIGLPWCKVTLFRVSRADFALLMTYAGEVSIYVLNGTDNAYQTFNAKLQRPEANVSAKWSADAIGGWTDVELLFYDLEAQ